MRYSDTPSKIRMVITTLILGVVALLITHKNQDISHWTMFLLVGLACYIVSLWTSYSWERTWSQEWNNLDKQLEEMRHKLEEWTSCAWEKTRSQEWNNLDKQLEEMRHKLDTLDIDDPLAAAKLANTRYEYVEFREKCGENVKEVWSQPLQCTQGLLPLSVTDLLLKTRAKLKDLHVVEASLDGMVAQMEAADDLTLNDFDKARINFHKHLYIQMQQGKMTPIGCVVLNSIFYGTLTEDFYDLLETEVELHPEDFPENFLTSVRIAKSQFRQTYSEE